MSLDNLKISIDKKKVAEYCQKWKIIELSLFGSVLRNDFHDGSDVDVIVRFKSNARWSLFDLVSMERELSDVIGRKVDLVTNRSVERNPNWIRRRSILNNAELIYHA